MERIRCKIKQTIFNNAENGYTVFRVSIDGGLDWDTLVGTFHDMRDGTVLDCDGEVKDEKFRIDMTERVKLMMSIESKIAEL